MSKSTISTFQLFERFPDQEAARIYLEGRLWPNGPTCPQCHSGARVTARPGGSYRCGACNKFTFTVRDGTIFGASKIPLHKWVYASRLVITVTEKTIAFEYGVIEGRKLIGWDQVPSKEYILSKMRGVYSTAGHSRQGVLKAERHFVGGFKVGFAELVRV